MVRKKLHANIRPIMTENVPGKLLAYLLQPHLGLEGYRRPTYGREGIQTVCTSR
jgi:hypothetical protein